MVKPPWEPEHVLSLAQAQALIAVQCPQLKPLNLNFLGAGWDNTVFEVNREYIFRFPRRPIAVELLQTEAEFLGGLAEQLPLVIPRPCFFGAPQGDYPWPFLGYYKVVGQTACHLALNLKERQTWIRPLAEFLKILHHLPCPKTGLPGDKIGRMDLPKQIQRLEARRLEKEWLSLEQDWQICQNLIEQVKTLSPQARSLCHGDLYIRHLVGDTAKNLVGIIDWGDLHWGDPAVDLAIVYSFFPPELQPEFWRVYGEVSEATQSLARFRALTHRLALWRYTLETQDPYLLREVPQSLGYILDSF